MNYKLLVTRQFEKDIKKLDKSIRERILKKIEELKTRPLSFKALHGILKGKYSLRIGDYRVIYVVDDKKKIVTIFCVDHRGRIYKRIELIKIQKYE